MNYQLKYLFVAVYNDNTHYQQSSEDVSKKNPKKSSFFDVDKDKLVKFFIASETTAVCVDLIDGHFEINNVPFRLHSDLDEFKDFKLVYFRDVRRHFKANSLEPIGIDVIYQIGWECEKDGVKHKRVIEVD